MNAKQRKRVCKSFVSSTPSKIEAVMKVPDDYIRIKKKRKSYKEIYCERINQAPLEIPFSQNRYSNYTELYQHCNYNNTDSDNGYAFYRHHLTNVDNEQQKYQRQAKHRYTYNYTSHQFLKNMQNRKYSLFSQRPCSSLSNKLIFNRNGLLRKRIKVNIDFNELDIRPKTSRSNKNRPSLQCIKKRTNEKHKTQGCSKTNYLFNQKEPVTIEFSTSGKIKQSIKSDDINNNDKREEDLSNSSFCCIKFIKNNHTMIYFTNDSEEIIQEMALINRFGKSMNPQEITEIKSSFFSFIDYCDNDDELFNDSNIERLNSELPIKYYSNKVDIYKGHNQKEQSSAKSKEKSIKNLSKNSSTDVMVVEEIPLDFCQAKGNDIEIYLDKEDEGNHHRELKKEIMNKLALNLAGDPDQLDINAKSYLSSVSKQSSSKDNNIELLSNKADNNQLHLNAEDNFRIITKNVKRNFEEKKGLKNMVLQKSMIDNKNIKASIPIKPNKNSANSGIRTSSNIYKNKIPIYNSSKVKSNTEIKKVIPIIKDSKEVKSFKQIEGISQIVKEDNMKFQRKAMSHRNTQEKNEVINLNMNNQSNTIVEQNTKDINVKKIKDQQQVNIDSNAKEKNIINIESKKNTISKELHSDEIRLLINKENNTITTKKRLSQNITHTINKNMILKDQSQTHMKQDKEINEPAIHSKNKAQTDMAQIISKSHDIDINTDNTNGDNEDIIKKIILISKNNTTTISKQATSQKEGSLHLIENMQCKTKIIDPLNKHETSMKPFIDQTMKNNKGKSFKKDHHELIEETINTELKDSSISINKVIEQESTETLLIKKSNNKSNEIMVIDQSENKSSMSKRIPKKVFSSNEENNTIQHQNEEKIKDIAIIENTLNSLIDISQEKKENQNNENNNTDRTYSNKNSLIQALNIVTKEDDLPKKNENDDNHKLIDRKEHSFTLNKDNEEKIKSINKTTFNKESISNSIKINDHIQSESNEEKSNKKLVVIQSHENEKKDTIEKHKDCSQENKYFNEDHSSNNQIMNNTPNKHDTIFKKEIESTISENLNSIYHKQLAMGDIKTDIKGEEQGAFLKSQALKDEVEMNNQRYRIKEQQLPFEQINAKSNAFDNWKEEQKMNDEYNLPLSMNISSQNRFEKTEIKIHNNKKLDDLPANKAQEANEEISKAKGLVPHNFTYQQKSTQNQQEEEVIFMKDHSKHSSEIHAVNNNQKQKNQENEIQKNPSQIKSPIICPDIKINNVQNNHLNKEDSLETPINDHNSLDMNSVNDRESMNINLSIPQINLFKTNQMNLSELQNKSQREINLNSNRTSSSIPYQEGTPISNQQHLNHHLASNESLNCNTLIHLLKKSNSYSLSSGRNDDFIITDLSLMANTKGYLINELNNQGQQQSANDSLNQLYTPDYTRNIYINYMQTTSNDLYKEKHKSFSNNSEPFRHFSLDSIRKNEVNFKQTFQSEHDLYSDREKSNAVFNTYDNCIDDDNSELTSNRKKQAINNSTTAIKNVIRLSKQSVEKDINTTGIKNKGKAMQKKKTKKFIRKTMLKGVKQRFDNKEKNNEEEYESLENEEQEDNEDYEDEEKDKSQEDNENNKMKFEELNYYKHKDAIEEVDEEWDESIRNSLLRNSHRSLRLSGKLSSSNQKEIPNTVNDNDMRTTSNLSHEETSKKYSKFQSQATFYNTNNFQQIETLNNTTIPLSLFSQISNPLSSQLFIPNANLLSSVNEQRDLTKKEDNIPHQALTLYNESNNKLRANNKDLYTSYENISLSPKNKEDTIVKEAKKNQSTQSQFSYQQLLSISTIRISIQKKPTSKLLSKSKITISIKSSKDNNLTIINNSLMNNKSSLNYLQSFTIEKQSTFQMNNIIESNSFNITPSKPKQFINLNLNSKEKCQIYTVNKAIKFDKIMMKTLNISTEQNKNNNNNDNQYETNDFNCTQVDLFDFKLNNFINQLKLNNKCKDANLTAFKNQKNEEIKTLKEQRNNISHQKKLTQSINSTNAICNKDESLTDKYQHQRINTQESQHFKKYNIKKMLIDSSLNNKEANIQIPSLKQNQKDLDGSQANCNLNYLIEEHNNSYLHSIKNTNSNQYNSPNNNTSRLINYQTLYNPLASPQVKEKLVNYERFTPRLASKTFKKTIIITPRHYNPKPNFIPKPEKNKSSIKPEDNHIYMNRLKEDMQQIEKSKKSKQRMYFDTSNQRKKYSPFINNTIMPPNNLEDVLEQKKYYFFDN